MPDFVTDFLFHWRNYIWLGVLGLLGSTGNLLIHRAAGKQITTAQAQATLFMGTLLAVVCPGFIGSYLLGIDAATAGGLGLCAVISGMLGIKLGNMLINTELPPIGKGGPTE